MNIVPLPVSDLNNIPAMLRRLADDIESGEHGHVVAALTVVIGEETGVFGFGDNPSPYHAAGILQAGIMEILG